MRCGGRFVFRGDGCRVATGQGRGASVIQLRSRLTPGARSRFARPLFLGCVVPRTWYKQLMTNTRWREIPSDTVPDRVRFDVAPQDQGQVIEVAYGGYGAGDIGNERVAPFKRVVDRSVGPAAKYYHRVTEGE